MYSTEFFIARFQDLDTDALVEKLATQELTDEARQALIQVLRDRGKWGDALEGEMHQSRRNQHLRTGVDNRCDFCGKSLLTGAFAVEGQKFCGIDCFHTSRLRMVGEDISDERAAAHARVLKAGSCPRCGKAQQSPDMHKAHFIASMVFVVTTSTETTFSCRACANRSNLWAMLSCATLGWWSLPGIFATPYRVLWNAGEMLRRKPAPEPSSALVDSARMALADVELKAAGAGRYGLRA